MCVRMYCKDLKPPEKNQNNTEFLIEFNKYIDNETPNHPSCEYIQASIAPNANWKLAYLGHVSLVLLRNNDAFTDLGQLQSCFSPNHSNNFLVCFFLHVYNDFFYLYKIGLCQFRNLLFFLLFIIKNMLLKWVQWLWSSSNSHDIPRNLGIAHNCFNFTLFSPPEAENNESNLLALGLI